MDRYKESYLDNHLNNNPILYSIMSVLMYNIPGLDQTGHVKNANGSNFRINFNRNCVHQPFMGVLG